ncbi:uncharacterized protein [Miscanthus floridulus]|uniref:uncharacterized protein n=1 Tax=Miscanthus floridulus TaxID=154761 RepID=UPI00345A3446
MRMTKILIDGGSGINILYKDAFDKLRKMHASQSPFHGIVLGQRVMPLCMIDHSMKFSDTGPYSTIFGRPCYAKFMAVPNYAYLKLKMHNPRSVIMVSGNFQNAYHCERDIIKYVEANNLDSGTRSKSHSEALAYTCSA